MAVDHAALFIASSVFNGLAMILTLFRLFFRLRIERLWWEDMWAAVMLVCGMTFSIAQLISFETVNYDTALVTAWMSSLAFTSTVWMARMSLLYSTIRVISPSSVLRKLTRVMTVVFFLFWATVIVLKTCWCVHNTKAMLTLGSEYLVCNLPKVVIVFQPITNCVSDAVLVYLSLKLLWRAKLPRRRHRMILTLFSSSILISMSSLSHAICQLMVSFEKGMYITFEIEFTSALIVCNLLVVVTYMYRVILSSPSGSLPSESEEDDDFTTPIRTNTATELTTIDLDVSPCTTAEAANSNLSSGVSSSFNSA
ncbi:hypothetical protein EV363DRAFT_1399840 [Boletus edulis]|nr:hypothetical protein EV363DRAFT_1399840 [Boletus edulis]